MKRIAATLFSLLLLAGCAASSAPQKPLLEKDLVVLYTNDIHCGADEGLGYAGLSALKKELAAENHLLLVDAGDAIQGAPIGILSQGEALIDLMNLVGYDLAVPGNHEFDYGMAQFLSLTERANFPYICANFIDNTTAKPVFPPYLLREIEGVTIAFVGVDTPKAITASTPTYFMDENGNYRYHFCQGETGSQFYQTVQSAITAAQKEGADYIIAVTHLGIEDDVVPYRSMDLIEHTTGLDVVLDGHSHSEIECQRVKDADGNYVLLSSTGTKLKQVGMLLLSKEGNLSTGLIRDYEGKDPAIVAALSAIDEQYAPTLSKVIGSSTTALTSNDPATGLRRIRKGEINLGNFCTDAYRYVGEAEVAIANGGGIRADLPAGALSYQQLLKVQPFGNGITVVEATGQELLDALELGARVAPDENGGFLQVSGLSYTIDTTVKSSVLLDENAMFQAVNGDYRVKEVLVNGKPLELDKAYSVAGSEYLLKKAGDGYTMFQDNRILRDGIALDHQALVRYLTEALGGEIGERYANPLGEGRITLLDEAS